MWKKCAERWRDAFPFPNQKYKTESVMNRLNSVFYALINAANVCGLFSLFPRLPRASSAGEDANFLPETCSFSLGLLALYTYANLPPSLLLTPNVPFEK